MIWLSAQPEMESSIYTMVTTPVLNDRKQEPFFFSTLEIKNDKSIDNSFKLAKIKNTF